MNALIILLILGVGAVLVYKFGVKSGKVKPIKAGFKFEVNPEKPTIKVKKPVKYG